ncbi:MAG: HD domain-containing protein [Lachnospiraceae bacterium]|nr:HD domain-containing protein [Lachnospiraceae bacterium]
MHKNNLGLYKKKLRKKLDNERYEHTIGVAYTAAALAMRYGADLEKAQIAGILHDNAKCFSLEKSMQMIEKYNIPVTEAEKLNPALLHSKVGAYLAMHKYKISDKEIIRAILYHTTGRPNMTLLEKIIYIADYIEPMRHKAQNLPEIRRLAFIDLDKALLKILSDTLEYLEKCQIETDPLTEKTYDFYKNIRPLQE